MAGFEAIAWGTVFSLLSARPLVAICQAIFAISLVSSLLFHFVGLRTPTPFVATMPWRTLVALAVLIVDVRLGLRWLDARGLQTASGMAGGRGSVLARLQSRPAADEVAIEQAASETEVQTLLVPDRGTMLGHLIWQHLAQSARMMITFAGIWIGLQLLIVWAFSSSKADLGSAASLSADAAIVSLLVGVPVVAMGFWCFAATKGATTSVFSSSTTFRRAMSGFRVKQFGSWHS